jgi:serine/threonine-protein kinase
MSLENGKQLGSYTVVEPLGAGGMGEVYRATDTKLDREVAIKVLPDSMAHDPERVARFEREAKVLAQLNHPMIAAIHGFDKADGRRFLVLELVEGPTLADRLESGRLSVEECLDIARQIAEALEFAHDKGIVHRDLKPANVKVTAAGEVKVLDFGLAKALVAEDTSSDPAMSPTITREFTAPGMILGTAAYMSPEQARGRPVDKRSDIWSFGCVLFECLTGKSTFRGETVTDSIGAILHKQPDWSLLPAETPPAIRLCLSRCLAKDRKRRLRDIGDARIELEAAIADPTSSALGLANQALAAKAHPSWSIGGGLGAIVASALMSVLVMLGIGWFFWPEPPVPPAELSQPAVERYTYTLPQRESLASPASFSSIDVARDGSAIVYEVRSLSGGNDLFLRTRADLVPKRIASSTREQFRFPTLSPDGEWLVYGIPEEMRVVKRAVRGGPTTTLCRELKYVDGLSWSPSGDFLVMAENDKPDTLLRVNANGGQVEEIKLPHEEKSWIRFLQVLPGDRAVLYVTFQSRYETSPGKIRVFSFETGEIKELIPAGTFPLYASSGHLLFLVDSTLMAAPFDVDSLDLTGAAVPVVEEVWQSRYGWAQIAISDDGTLYYRQGEGQEEALKSIYLRQLEGDTEAETISAKSGLYRQLAIAPPDGRYIAIQKELNDYDEEEGSTTISILDRLRDVATPLGLEHGKQVEPVFSPDGTWIYVASYDEEENWLGIYRHRREVGGETELIYSGPRPCFPASTTPDGQSLLVSESNIPDFEPGTEANIAVIHLGRDGEQSKKESVYEGPRRQDGAQVSPNGRWIAFASTHEGSTPRLYVMPITGKGFLYKVLDSMAAYPFWAPDGNTLYFQTFNRESNTRRLMAAQVIRGAEPDGEQPSEIFEVGEISEVMEGQTGSRGFWMMPDGKSILEIADEPNEEEEKDATDDPGVFHVTRNFFNELNRLAPTKKAASIAK